MKSPLANFEADVIIIGAGAGGGSAAWRLSHYGFKVLVLDAGPSYSPSDYRQSSHTWEKPFPYKTASKSAYEVAELQPIHELKNELRSWNKMKGLLVKGSRRANFGYHHVRGVGGSSLHFTGEAHRLNPDSMQMKTQHGVAADWPMGYKELEPYYQTAEERVGVAGPLSDTRCPRSAKYPQPPHPYSFAAKVLDKAAIRVGHQPQANSLAVLSKPYDNRPACNYCGGCQRGCMLTDKGSIDVTYLKHALASGNCQILPETEVLKLETHHGRISSILASHKGKLHKLSAQWIILAAGAVQTPRLLLNSKNAHYPHGIGNQNGQVGQNFMETLLTTVSAEHPEKLGSHRGLPVNWVSWKYNAPDSIPGVIGGCRFGPSMSESDLVGPVAYATRVIPGWGLKHKARMREQLGKVLSITSIGECLPHKKSYISLSDQLDQHGIPVPRIHSYLDQNAMARLAFMNAECRKILDAAGCDSPFETFSSADAFSSTHVFGTCRMGTDPRQSVCDAFGSVHDIKNLFICDASLFPSTGGGESPGLTIQALAIRSADYIRTLN
ncbi:GMC family oxidoreductase [Endozoicomonas arenosclerae]|uniref:GMC family oxidoreductase n=1 Tax=Endozoicomonas arenosclerae TaxID=1633495 RepID=UPI0007820F71|nr:GMC family oxidoreductase [Endozoicomonas arenosclerae]